MMRMPHHQKKTTWQRVHTVHRFLVVVVVRVVGGVRHPPVCQQNQRSRLPSSRLIIAYATDRSLRENKVVRACSEHGVNVIIWAFTHLEVDADGRPGVRATFDVEAVRRTKKAIAEKGLEVAHLTAFGGWNGPHPSPNHGDGAAWFEVWKHWAGDVFDGVDWDLEGHDDPRAETTVLGPRLVDLVSDFTNRAKLEGYVVGVAPAESYLDALGDGAYSTRLNNQPLAGWERLDFPYAGRNAYAPLVLRCDFDFVSVQFYEGYSRACFETTSGRPLADYLVDVADALRRGFNVRLGSVDAEVALVAVPPRKLVFGFANSWADGQKFLRADPTDIADAFARLGPDHAPRGVMFWVLDEERQGDFFAQDLALALSTRAPDTSGPRPHDDLRLKQDCPPARADNQPPLL